MSKRLNTNKKKMHGGFDASSLFNMGRKALAGVLKSDPVQKGIQNAVQKAIKVVEGDGKKKIVSRGYGATVHSVPYGGRAKIKKVR
jgi:hypothetical protein